MIPCQALSEFRVPAIPSGSKREGRLLRQRGSMKDRLRQTANKFLSAATEHTAPEGSEASESAGPG